LRVIILTRIILNEFEYDVLKKILNSSHDISGWIIDIRKPKSVMQKLKNNIKKGRGGFVLIMAFRLLAKKIFRKKDKTFDISSLIDKSRAPVYRTKVLNSPDIIMNIKNICPDAMILLGAFGIIKKDVLNLCQYGVLSYHHGDMRKYRGQPFGFWELYNKETEIGVTVQKLDEGLDCGEAVLERKYPVYYRDTLHKLRKRIYEASIDMMVKSMDFIEKEKPLLKKFDEYGKVYSLPNLRQWIAFNLKIFFRTINILKHSNNK